MLIVILCRVLHLRLKDDAVPLSTIINHNTTDKVSLWRRLSIIDLNHYTVFGNIYRAAPLNGACAYVKSWEQRRI